MPNSPRGGGISRKITSISDRKRLKDVIAELDLPKGMGLIVRTAGANRPKPEIKRDCEYLLRLWDDIREHTLESIAPALIYEEASLIKRAIRDVYSRDIDEVLVDGDDGWKAARDFMRMLMPAHAKKVQLWRDNGQPLFAKYQVEAQLDGMLLPTVQLRSGGYLVINQAEALVAIDVNSGRSTRERNIEETALRTDLEAADEIARQLRLRDLAGLIVIDFIDMESKKHNSMVERRLKEALKNDRARIQVGHISHFGLLEMSRQRLRPSLAETSFIACPHCGGTGHVRSTESGAIHVLRGIEEEGSKHRAAEITVYVSTPVALYLLNHKRERLREIEMRYGMRVVIAGDDTQIAPQFRIERVRAQTQETRQEAQPQSTSQAVRPDARPQRQEAAEPGQEAGEEEIEDQAEEAGEDTAAEDTTAEDTTAEDTTADGSEDNGDDPERRRRRRRRRRRGQRREEETGADEPALVADMPPPVDHAAAELPAGPVSEAITETRTEGVPEHGEVTDANSEEEDGRGRRRGRRGGKRRRRDETEAPSPYAEPGAEQPDLPPVYIGPTPANPFGGHAFDIFDVMEQAEQSGGKPPVPAERAVQDEAPADDRPSNQPEETGSPEVRPASVVEPSALPEPSSDPQVPELEPLGAAPTEAAQRVSEPAHAEPALAEPAPAEPAIKPIVIGGEDEPPVAERKRGWWRR
jgi:ribonuclease E